MADIALTPRRPKDPGAGWQTVAPGASPPRLSRRWLRLPPDPALVREARDHAMAAMTQAGVREEGLLGDVRLLVSEAVTNAVRAAERHAVARGRPWASYELPVALRVDCRPRWVHLLVIDPDPQVPNPAPRDLLDETGGRGMAIIEEFAALWWFRPGTYGKTLHAVAVRPGEVLTSEEIGRAAVRRRPGARAARTGRRAPVRPGPEHPAGGGEVRLRLRRHAPEPPTAYDTADQKRLRRMALRAVSPRPRGQWRWSQAWSTGPMPSPSGKPCSMAPVTYSLARPTASTMSLPSAR